ncbi:MAG TPA: putative lipid II flippase FtsW [Acidimicrobiales bacterium]|nr:putative lipid II flippase FtsW [Acidimicrobiales bacterium]
MSIIPIGVGRAARAERAGAGTETARRAPSSFYLLMTVLVILNLTGVVMVLSASSVLSISQFGNPWYYFERQLLWLGLGTVAFLVALKVDRRAWRRLAKVGIVVAFLLLLAVLVPHVGKSAGGASRWLGTSSFEIQPSELSKLLFIFFAADVLERRADRAQAGQWRYQMGPVLVAFLGLVVLVMAQPDMGTSMVIALIAVAMLYTAGIPKRPLVGLIAAAVAGCAVMAVAAPYRWQRLTSFIDPLRHASDTGYQSVQGIAAIYSGHLAGQGLGNTVAATGYLPNAQTDYIFAIIGQETGMIGTILVAAVFLGLGLIGVRIACGAKDRFSGLVAAGITAWLVGQALVNIGAVIGLLPVVGVPLPFVSFGGSSLMIALFGAGLLGNIARRP